MIAGLSPPSFVLARIASCATWIIVFTHGLHEGLFEGIESLLALKHVGAERRVEVLAELADTAIELPTALGHEREKATNVSPRQAQVYI